MNKKDLTRIGYLWDSIRSFMSELITIAEFQNVNEAYVLKSRLEAEGIRTFITNENMNTILFSVPFANVKVQVSLHDSFRALDILYEE